MDFVNYGANSFDERNKLNSELSSLNEQKASQIGLLSLFIDGNKDVFNNGSMIDFNSIDNINQLREAFIYLSYSIKYSGVENDRASHLSGLLDDFYDKLVDIYDKIGNINEKIEQYESERKSNISDDDLRPSVEYINSVNAIGNRIGEKRNKIAIITNYIKNIDTDDFMKDDHRKMIETLENEISLDMAEVCKLLASRNLDIDDYRNYRSNVRYNLTNMRGTSLSLDSTLYDVMYYEYNDLSNLLRSTKKTSVEENNTPEPKIEENNVNPEEPTSSIMEEPIIEEPVVEELPVDDNPVDNNPENDTPEEKIDDEYSDYEDIDEDLDDDFDEEREPVDNNSPLTQFRDKFKHSVKGISTAGSKLKRNISGKVLGKSALRWVGVVGVLAVAAVINPALLFGGAAIGAGVYEYNIAKKMK